MPRDDRPTAQDKIRLLEEELRTAREDLDLLVRSGRWLVWSCIVRTPRPDDPWWRWDFRDEFSQVFPAWFDIDRTEGESLATCLNRSRLAEDSVLCDQRCHDALGAGLPGYSQNFRIRLRGGGISWVEENVTIHPIEEGKWHLVGVCIDATERKLLQDELLAQNEALVARDRLQQEKLLLLQANARLADMATRDALTGILNFRGFQECLAGFWDVAAERRSLLSLILLDVDFFKQFNDRFGHLAGDEVLKRIGRILMENARAGDCVARYGGEEFAVLVRGLRPGGVVAVAERFRAAIENAEWPDARITASFGVSSSAPPNGSAQHLIEEADRALYHAKDTGRNRVSCSPRASSTSDDPKAAARALPARLRRPKPSPAARQMRPRARPRPNRA